MQVACPFIQASDSLVLGQDFAIQGDVLYDLPVGAGHRLHGEAPAILRLLEQPCDYSTVMSAAQIRRLKAADIQHLLGFLNHIGALTRGRAWQKWPAALASQARLALLGVTFSGLTWRRQAAAATLFQACLRACLPVILASVPSYLLARAAGMTEGLALYAGTILMFVGSIALHEMAHVLILRRHAPGLALVQRGLRLGIIHPALPWRVEWQSALAGPAAGIGSCAVVAGVLGLAGQWFAAIMITLVGLFHLGSLLPGYSDGHSIWRGIRQAVRRRSHA